MTATDTLLQTLTDCLRALDQLGQDVAAAHVNAAIHALLAADAPQRDSSETG